MGTKHPSRSVQRKPAADRNPRVLKRKREVENIESIETKVRDLDSSANVQSFSDLPLSQATYSGLEASHFKSLTDIQRQAIPLALKGRDILGAAKTGSGKTLAFLVPVLENLYRKRWTEYDGLGALVLSPTRELAIQIFEVLRKVGRYHTFSAGLLIGGKSLQEERERLGRMNILVATPGRMLQHLDQTAELEVGNMQMLVLDEADRILDMGFQTAVDAIVEHLPTERQTLLFSATQTKKVSDLARLSLRDAAYVSVHETAESATPSSLQQHYVLAPLPQKLDVLWSFIRANLKSKILVFLSSGKQVRFVYESFRHMQPGIPLLHLHGRQKQTARLDITTRFASSSNACLFATDVVARGLDFPAVDWVIQFDCPEDADTYIHRAGRTARYERNGRAVLFLDPSEEKGMLQRLQQKKVPIEQIKVRQKKQQSIRDQLQNMCFKDPEVKYLGQKAFVSYVRSIHVQKDKEIFDIRKYDLEDFSASLGLPGAPRIRFRKGEDVKALKNAPRQALLSSSDGEDEDEDVKGVSSAAKKAAAATTTRTKYDRMFERRNQDVLSSHYNVLREGDDDDNEIHGDSRKAGKDTAANKNKLDSDSENDFLSVKRRLSSASVSSSSDDNDSNTSSKNPKIPAIPLGPSKSLPIDSARRQKLLKSKKAITKLKPLGTKLVFDDAGNPHSVYELEDEAAFKARGEPEKQRERWLAEEAERVAREDEVDKGLAKEKRRERRERRRERERVEREAAKTTRAAVLDTAGDEKVIDPFADDEDDEGEEEEGVNTIPTKPENPKTMKKKKWFQQDSDSDTNDNSPKSKKKQKKGKHAEVEVETLEDLERLARATLS